MTNISESRITNYSERKGFRYRVQSKSGRVLAEYDNQGAAMRSAKEWRHAGLLDVMAWEGDHQWKLVATF